MYTSTRVIRFKNVASMMAGMPICLQILQYWKNTLKQDVSLMTPVLGGHPARVLFVVRSEDIESNLRLSEQANKDKKNLALVAKLSELVDGSATNDQVWKTIA